MDVEKYLKKRAETEASLARAVRETTLGEAVADLLRIDGKITATSLRAELRRRVDAAKSPLGRAMPEEALKLVNEAIGAAPKKRAP